MATISYRIKKSKSEFSTIYLNFRIPKGKVIELSTTLSVLPDQWSSSKQLAKNTIAENKKLNSSLLQLRKYLISKLNEPQSGLITTKKIKFWINECFNRVNENDLNDIHSFTEKFLKLSPNLKFNTIKGYKNFLVTLNKFEKKNGGKIYLEEATRSDMEKLTYWMKTEMTYSQSTVSSHFKNLKSILNKAHESGLNICPLVREYNVPSNDSSEGENKVILTVKDFNKLKKVKLSSKMLNNARKWLLIGLNIGQRGGDLLNLTYDNVRVSENELVLIDIIQEKTGRHVTIPVKDIYVKSILLNQKSFPHRISIQKFNKYMKQICKEAGIDDRFEGYIRDNRNKKIKFTGPKYHFITSHCMRRSFATHYYTKVPTPVIMEITGHKRESTFLTYINKQHNKDDNAKLFASYL